MPETVTPPECELRHDVRAAPLATHEAVAPTGTLAGGGNPYYVCAEHAAGLVALEAGGWEVMTFEARDAAPTRLFVVSSNLPGYLPTDDDPAVVHAHVGPDASNYQIRRCACELASIMAELVIRDGESSAEEADSEVTSEDDREGQEDAAGDYGMVELWKDGSEAYSDAVAAISTALRNDDQFVYTYIIRWTANTLAYFVARTDADVCSDDSCDICYVDIVPAV